MQGAVKPHMCFKNVPIINILKHYFQVEVLKCKHWYKLGTIYKVLEGLVMSYKWFVHFTTLLSKWGYFPSSLYDSRMLYAKGVHTS